MDLCESHVVHIYRAAHQEVGILGKRTGPLIGDANSSAIWIGTTVGVGLRHVTRDVHFGSQADLLTDITPTAASGGIADTRQRDFEKPRLYVRFHQ